MSTRKRQEELIGRLTAVLADATEQLKEAVDIMRECPNCSQHVHRKGRPELSDEAIAHLRSDTPPKRRRAYRDERPPAAGTTDDAE